MDNEIYISYLHPNRTYDFLHENYNNFIYMYIYSKIYDMISIELFVAVKNL